MNLKNNSLEMKTIVETFVIEETQELIYDNEKLDHWNTLVSELGLEGQTKIASPTKSPIPFMHIKKSMKNIFECLCPRKVEVEKYDVTPIPVEILDLIALAKREKHFDNIQIWYDDKSPDPFCVGIKGSYYCYDKGYRRIEGLSGMTLNDAQSKKRDNSSVYDIGNESMEHYLLGKWADVKHSFKELKEMATSRFVQEKENECKKKIKEAQRELDDLTALAFDQFN